MALLNGLEKVVGRVVDSGDQVGISLSVGSPHDNNLVEAVVGLEVADILANLLDVGSGGLGPLEDIVGAILLVGSDEVGVVDGGKRNHASHLLPDLSLESGLENLGAVHGLSQVKTANVPTANDEVIGMDHRQDVVKRNVDLSVSFGIGTELEGRAHDNRAVVVSLLVSFLGLPGELSAIGENTGGNSGTVVTTPADQHHTDSGDLAVDLEVVEGLLGSSDVLSLGIGLYLSCAIGVLGSNLRLGVGNIG